MLILFFHGWNSTPGGIKPTYLKKHGHSVFSPKLPDGDFDDAVWIAQIRQIWQIWEHRNSNVGGKTVMEAHGRCMRWGKSHAGPLISATFPNR